MKQGNWKYKKSNQTVIYENTVNNSYYEVDLEITPHKGWLDHLQTTKTYMTKTDLSHFNLILKKIKKYHQIFQILTLN